MQAVRTITNIVLLILVTTAVSLAQQQATIAGRLLDEEGNPLILGHVKVEGFGGVTTDEDGRYSIDVPANRALTVTFSYTGFNNQEFYLNLKQGQVYPLEVKLRYFTLRVVDVEAYETRSKPMIKIPTKVLDYLPTASGNFEAVLFAEASVASNNELTAGYSVRGGNYDENLIYVNGIEIYRPFLVRSGQQEGLSFINSNMVSSILFSAGGFEAKYGDKLSSVLDIQYKKPIEFGGSASMSLLGGSAHIEGASKNYRLSHISGFRYRSNQYILGSLDTQGDYKPAFSDFQTYITYDWRENFELSFLGHYSNNKYQFIPQNRETEFGTINQALRFTVFFDGQEIDEFETFTGAISGTHRSFDERVTLQFIASAFKTFESESFDIQGQYWLDELERDLGDEDFGDVAFNLGVGTFLNHARNNLEALVYNASHKGTLDNDKTLTEWGVKYQHEIIEDRLSEWNMVDSAGFSIPQAPANEIQLQEVVKSRINLESNRYSGYLQNTWFWSGKDSIAPADYSFTIGGRANYWDFNNEVVFSPRMNFSLQPNWTSKTKIKARGDTIVKDRDWLFRFSSGFYYQPPFYREMRDFNGVINPNIEAQQSVHFVLGGDHNFWLWDRRFKLVTELYYKHLTNMIPYEIDNVRIRYYATNNAKGYAGGIEFKVNGEFVKGIESWASLSVMQTREDILDDFYYIRLNAAGDTIVPGFTFDQTATDSIRVEPGYIPRPTDQRVNFGIFFQDEMPRWPSFKVHLSLLFGTGLPFGPPTHERYKDILRTPPYRRVDIGFSKQLLTKRTQAERKSFTKHFEDMWISAEVFNLLGINNTVSYLWINDVTGRQYAIPNFLTSRRVNVKLVIKF